MSRWSNYDKSASFWSRVDKVEDCLVWTGAINKHGYGTCSLNGKVITGHRLAFYLVYGYLPKELLDHLCRTRACVNPEHLDVVNNEENITRGNDSRGTCKNGHKRTAVNTGYVTSNRTGKKVRNCKVCLAINKGYSLARFQGAHS